MKNGYAGKIGHGGSQKVEAPLKDTTKNVGGKVIKGNDLRTGKGGK